MRGKKGVLDVCTVHGAKGRSGEGEREDGRNDDDGVRRCYLYGPSSGLALEGTCQWGGWAKMTLLVDPCGGKQGGWAGRRSGLAAWDDARKRG